MNNKIPMTLQSVDKKSHNRFVEQYNALYPHTNPEILEEYALCYISEPWMGSYTQILENFVTTPKADHFRYRKNGSWENIFSEDFVDDQIINQALYFLNKNHDNSFDGKFRLKLHYKSNAKNKRNAEVRFIEHNQIPVSFHTYVPNFMQCLFEFDDPKIIVWKTINAIWTPDN